MRRTILFCFLGLSIFCAQSVKANVVYKDLSGLLLSSYWVGPCYCTSTLTTTPVLSFASGETVDFGRVSISTFESGLTPDAGPNQPFFFLQSNVESSFGPPNPTFFLTGSSLSFSSCDQSDAACVTQELGSFVSVDLIFTIPVGASNIQLGWVGPYDYVAPVPEPSTWAMLMIGFTAIWFAGYRRSQRAVLAPYHPPKPCCCIPI